MKVCISAIAGLFVSVCMSQVVSDTPSLTGDRHEWMISSLSVGESWSVTFSCIAIEAGRGRIYYKTLSSEILKQAAEQLDEVLRNVPIRNPVLWILD